MESVHILMYTTADGRHQMIEVMDYTEAAREQLNEFCYDGTVEYAAGEWKCRETDIYNGPGHYTVYCDLSRHPIVEYVREKDRKV